MWFTIVGKSNEGKKIKLSDSWGILKEMVINRFK